MLSYCWKCKEKTDGKNPTIVSTKKRRMFLSNRTLQNQDLSRSKKQMGCWVERSGNSNTWSSINVVIVKNCVYLNIYYGCT